MPRNLSSSMLAALSAPVINPALFCEITFANGPVYIWSGIGPVSWNSQTWIGVGSFLNISSPEDSSSVEAKGITITLSGIDPTLLPNALTELQLGLPVLVYLAVYDSSHTLINTPVIAWAGRTDQPTIDVSANEVSIALNCENRLMDMNVSVDRRYTNEDAQLDNPGDLGFMFVDGLQETTLFWGGYPNASQNV